MPQPGSVNKAFASGAYKPGKAAPSRIPYSSAPTKFDEYRTSTADTIDESDEIPEISGHSTAALISNKSQSKAKLKSLEMSKPIDRHRYRFELWEGKNRFFCGGRIMTGVHVNHLLLTTVLLVVTYSVFLLIIVPLVKKPMLFFVGLFLCVANLLFLFLTAFTEPGIIPRRPPSQLLESMSPDMREKVQYCHTCRIIRPPRAKHCRYCDNCVEVFDHHCPWTGTCIGVRNYPYFFIFVVLTVLSSGFAAAVTGYVIEQWVEGISMHLDPTMVYVRDTVAPLICTWTLVVFLLVGALLIFHIFLIGRAQSTNEFLRGVKPHADHATCGNLVRLCCRSIPESKLLPMHEKRSEEDDVHDSNAVAHAISSLRAAIESSS